jgi:hypothetical protein
MFITFHMSVPMVVTITFIMSNAYRSVWELGE